MLVQTRLNIGSDSQSCALGVDVGGTAIKYALLQGDGKVLLQSSCPTPPKGDQIVAEIRELIASSMKHAAERKLVFAGAGVGVPAMVENGVVVGAADNTPELLGLDLKTILSSSLETPVVVDNDCQMMAIAENSYEYPRKSSNTIFLTVGTGIGGALKLKGELHGGIEPAHLLIKEGGNQCSCGSRGCLEAHASVTALIDHYSELSGLSRNRVSGKSIVEAYLQSDSVAKEAMNWHFDNLALGVASLINLFSPDRVIIGGGIADAGDFYIDEIQRRVRSLSQNAGADRPEIYLAKFGNRAGSFGAAATILVH